MIFERKRPRGLLSLPRPPHQFRPRSRFCSSSIAKEDPLWLWCMGPPHKTGKRDKTSQERRKEGRPSKARGLRQGGKAARTHHRGLRDQGKKEKRKPLSSSVGPKGSSSLRRKPLRRRAHAAALDRPPFVLRKKGRRSRPLPRRSCWPTLGPPTASRSRSRPNKRGKESRLRRETDLRGCPKG